MRLREDSGPSCLHPTLSKGAKDGAPERLALSGGEQATATQRQQQVLRLRRRMTTKKAKATTKATAPGREFTFPIVARSGALRMGHPYFWWRAEENGRASHDAHTSESRCGTPGLYIPPFAIGLRRMGHPNVWGEWRSAVALCAMPTLATMKLSRRWGTRLCGGRDVVSLWRVVTS